MMSKLLSFLIILVFLTGSALGADINGNVVSEGKKLAGLTVEISRLNGTADDENSITGVTYDFVPVASTVTGNNGNFVFENMDEGGYRVNVTYEGVTSGENIKLKNKTVVDFNLSGRVFGYVIKSNTTLVGVPVYLYDSYGILAVNTTSGKNGTYSFGKVAAGKNYYAQAVYAGVPYTSNVTPSPSASSDFIVYETTDKGDNIGVTIDHIVLSKSGNGIIVNEYIQFVNNGDRVFFSPDRTWLGIPTPRAISSFQTDVMECCLVRDEDAAWIDPMKPLMPGESYSTEISYVFNPNAEPVFFNRGVMYNTAYLSILSEKINGLGIESTSSEKKIVNVNDKVFEVLDFINIPGGMTLDVKIAGFVPSKNETGTDAGYLVPVLLVLSAGALSYPFIRKKMLLKKKKVFRESYSPIHPVDENTGITESRVYEEYNSGKTVEEMTFYELLSERNNLFESIMRLDNEFNSGNVKEQEYREQKKELRDSAVQVVKQLKDTATNLDLTQPVSALEEIIRHVGDIDVLEKLLEREEEGGNRNELKELIEDRIEDIERSE
ncbi:MAG: hypothetical protein OIN89_06970 [Candidatus Methanoperedens sp.]|jgi:hypothetical protein|nr:hypothetical protein [Candidatus Methanoperedens sp.]PKL53653.1 MAG: hypothetical protein CVV36_06035 [Candidatus Methanoperedenaceae archaeon HGW-Methanoperedenaceae-1]